MDWDYRQPAIYMLTLTLAERQPLLGRLVIPEQDGEPCPKRAYIKPSPIGSMIEQSLLEMERSNAAIQVLQYQLMPDHLHIALRVKQTMPQVLGDIIRILKRQTTRRAAELMKDGPRPYGAEDIPAGERTGAAELTDKAVESPLSLIDVPGNQSITPLWAPGFNDNRLRTRGQLQAMIAYIQDNPRRLALRRLRPELLRIRRSEQYAGLSFDAVGNMELLQREKKAVHVRSRWTAEEKRAYKNGCILAARQGAVLVGAFVSDNEKAVKRVALQEKLPLILLQENGFPELYKPSGELFDACAEGRLLLLAPWPYHTRRQTITREQCKLLNSMAERIAE